jgi:hypothetical protein
MHSKKRSKLFNKRAQEDGIFNVFHKKETKPWRMLQLCNEVQKKVIVVDTWRWVSWAVHYYDDDTLKHQAYKW